MKYYVIAGEASGDLHASNLVRGLLAEDPQAVVRAWGGPKLREAGAEVVHDYRGSDVMGITDTLSRAGSIIGSLRRCKADILAFAPDAVVLVDYPGFNLRIARFAHRKGLRVFYYIAPKTWATRSWRNRRLRQWVDRLFIVFPFEKEYFDKARVPYTYVGNPLLDAVDSHIFEPVCNEPYVALLPGSRKGEIERMMPVCVELARSLWCKVIVAGAPNRSMADYEPYIAGEKNIEVVFGRTYDILKGAKAAVVNSGTASLEAALTATPQVVCWSTSRFTAWVARKILHVYDHIKYVSLANLILDKAIFKELVQEDFTLDNLTREVSDLLGNESRRKAMADDYARLREVLGGSGASRYAATEMIKEIKHI